MLREDDHGNWTNWEESQLYLEQTGLLEREVFEQELALWHQDPKYSFKNAANGFEYTLYPHLQARMKAQKPNRSWYPRISANNDCTKSKIYLDSWIPNSGHQYRYCACPDWLTALYRREVNQHRTIRDRYPIGTLLYSASADTVYVVYDTSSIGAAEAADLEDGFDVFDAEGDYSFLRYPYTDEQRLAAQGIYERHQGIIGAIELHIGAVNHFDACPKVLFPGKYATHSFEYHGSKHEPVDPDCRSFGGGYCFYDEQAEQKARAFLFERYPDIHIIDWHMFESLEKQRIF